VFVDLARICHQLADTQNTTVIKHTYPQLVTNPNGFSGDITIAPGSGHIRSSTVNGSNTGLASIKITVCACT